MANLDTLHLKHLEPFTLWLMEQGYQNPKEGDVDGKVS